MLAADTRALLDEVATHRRVEHEAERNKALRQLKFQMAQKGLGASSAFDQSATQIYQDAVDKFASRLWTEVKQFLEQTHFSVYPDCERDLIQFFDEALSTAAEADSRSLKSLPDQVHKPVLDFHYKQVGGKIATDVRILCRKLQAMKERPQNLTSGKDEAVNQLPGSKPVKDGRTVFVVHGRNRSLRDSMFDFLRAIGLRPLEWSQAIAATQEATPYIGQVLDTAFSIAQAVVVLMTPDDDACLREEFRLDHDPQQEREPTGQARPNVLFEAGMAMGRDGKRTVLVEVGTLRPFSDIVGRHVVRLNDSVERRQDLAERLKTAGCAVDLVGGDWHKAGSFELADKALPAKAEAASSGLNQALRFEDSVYWKYENGQKTEVPFCPVCHDGSNKMVRLHNGDDYGGGHRWFCLVCHNGFGGEGSGMIGSFS